MKKIILTVFVLAINSPAAFAQSPVRHANMGGGEYVVPHTECVLPAQRIDINQMLEQNKAMLRQNGYQRAPSAAPPKLKWPLSQVSSYNSVYNSYYGISNYVDHNSNYPNLLQDWNCGSRTYDTPSGYNHAGTDIFLWPFSWKMMQNQQVKVVAAAPGIIIGKSDGNFDKNCSSNNNNWNAVYIEHADGSVAWYGHLKKNSVTSKAVGASVTAGEVLGRVGSSGNSTGPHLHFELYDSSNALVDPWKGSCNNISSSWWKTPKPYYDSKCNAIMTHSAPPVFPACPTVEILNQSDVFHPGDQVYFASYFHDQKSGQVAYYKIFYPNGSVYASWNNTFNTYYSASWWYWSYFLPGAGPLGTWNYQIIFKGDTLNHAFAVTSPVNQDPKEKLNSYEGSEIMLEIFPNPSAGNFTVQLVSSAMMECEVAVFNVLGEKVMFRKELLTEGNNRLEIIMEAQPPGIYFLQCNTPSGQLSRKLIRK